MVLFRNKAFQVKTQHFLKIYSKSKLTMNAPLQKSKQILPQLPVPILSDTLNKYLRSVHPFLNELELSKTKTLLSQFQSENGLGPKLQNLLVQRAKEHDNWLADWWLNNAYLAYRDPVVVYSSPGLVFPCAKFSTQQDQVQYTAKLISAALSYKLLIDSGKMATEMMGKDPLDMNQYNKIFGTCRIPGVTQDNLEFNPQSRHIVVIRNNNFFKLEVISNTGNVINIGELVSSLQEIVNESSQVGPPIGILTSDNRNNWGKTYKYLISDLENLKSIREIQTSLFVICLDKPMTKTNETYRTLASKQLIHGGGSKNNAANRWYDKTVQFIVSEDGVVGLTYEHSPSEGQPIAVMTDFILNYMKNDIVITQPDVAFYGNPEKISFDVDERVQEAIITASNNSDKLADNLDVDSFQFKTFGKDFVKSQKMSPDSFIQMAIQYAFYRIHKVPGAHYESAATRKYIDGRTETIRSCSNESIQFAKAMLDNSKTDADKANALKEAVKAHKQYSLEAVNGFGVDRHLLGLKLVALEKQLPVPEIFSDPSFVRSTYMRLSTSQVATACDGFMCYAPLVPDGYGCCYNPRRDDINFGVSTFAESSDTAASTFREALQSSLEDMQNVLLKTQKAKL